MRYFVTGAAGFIGSKYVRALLDGELPGEVESVTAYDKVTYAGDWRRLSEVKDDPRLTVVTGDICHWNIIRNHLPGHHVVVNFAAETHVDRSIVSTQTTAITNVLGVEAMLRTSIECDVETFVHVSTDEVYGSNSGGEPWTEDSPMQPNSPYSATKAAAEHLCRAWVQTFDMDVRVTRGSNTYGAWQHPEKLIPKALCSVMTGDRVPVYGDGLNVREWLHAADHVQAVHAVLQRGMPGEAYNVAGADSLTNLELLGKLLPHVTDRVEDSIQFVEDRPGHDRVYSMRDDKLRGLGWRPRVNIDEGLEATATWYKNNRDWWLSHLSRSSSPVR